MKAPVPPEGVILGDSLTVLQQLPDDHVDLVYIDPPFGTGQLRRLQAIRTGAGTKTRSGFGGRNYKFNVVSAHEYRDDMDLDEYLEFLGERLVEIHRVLRPTGSLYLHLDFHTVHYARMILDEIFGPDRFLNEIIWAYDYGGRPKDRWPRKHDNILWYSKSDRWTFNMAGIDRIPVHGPGACRAQRRQHGESCQPICGG